MFLYISNHEFGSHLVMNATIALAELLSWRLYHARILGRFAGMFNGKIVVLSGFYLCRYAI